MEYEQRQHLPLMNFPDTSLIIIAQYLPAADLVSLCDTHPRFSYLRTYLPEYLELPGEKINRSGPNYGDFIPELYFESPIMNQRIKKITLSFRWRDQGYGNRKGMLWIELVRNGTVIASNKDDIGIVAPHHEEFREVEIKNHPVVDLVKKGDVLNFMRNVGGGGGHKLHVNMFHAKLELKKF